MMRLTLTLAIWTGLVAVAPASLTPRKESALLGTEGTRAWRSTRPAVDTLGQTATRGTRPEYRLTNETEILLDGKPCRYEAIPANARIIRMEVGADKKTVLKILFRTRN